MITLFECPIMMLLHSERTLSPIIRLDSSTKDLFTLPREARRIFLSPFFFYAAIVAMYSWMFGHQNFLVLRARIQNLVDEQSTFAQLTVIFSPKKFTTERGRVESSRDVF
jgi:hypothetical protein